MMETLDFRALAVQEGAVRVIGLDALSGIALERNLSLRQVEIAALRAFVVPRRYLRNMGTIGYVGQIRLLESTVAVVGAGGLGGWVIEGLARMGVGRLIVIDGDTFEENNLNRQELCAEGNLGITKVEAARRRVAEVNSAVECITYCVRADEDHFRELVPEANVIVDALDNMPSRLALQKVAQQLGVPLIHGAIAGFVGQVMTIFPDDPGLFAFYGTSDVPERGVEVECGNPTATPMMVAAWQIQEVVKVLLEIGQPLRQRMLILDAESGTAEVIRLQ